MTVAGAQAMRGHPLRRGMRPARRVAKRFHPPLQSSPTLVAKTPGAKLGAASACRRFSEVRSRRPARVSIRLTRDRTPVDLCRIAHVFVASAPHAIRRFAQGAEADARNLAGGLPQCRANSHESLSLLIAGPMRSRATGGACRLNETAPFGCTRRSSFATRAGSHQTVEPIPSAHDHFVASQCFPWPVLPKPVSSSPLPEDRRLKGSNRGPRIEKLLSTELLKRKDAHHRSNGCRDVCRRDGFGARDSGCETACRAAACKRSGAGRPVVKRATCRSICKAWKTVQAFNTVTVTTRATGSGRRQLCEGPESCQGGTTARPIDPRP